MKTIFAKIIQGKVPASFVYQDEKVSAFMDIQPINPGHVLVIPNQEVASLTDLDEETGAHLFRIGHRIAKALRKSGLKCEGVDLFLADGQAAKQDVFYVHLHVFPRFAGDGFRWQFGQNYFNLPKREELERTAAAVKSALDSIESD
ncbi:HIT family protein [Pleurocapsa sp. PCC 7319]|uniref:HIT family protein n=1 Tax=Pleurocapsa sp. PCC 7319 TaxID=118161 RepID=UPI000345431B|nr:HIT family protein [Pleurocapsa sp. PCC 7319]